MGKYYGRIGYGIVEEDPDSPGVWKERLIWRNYYGDILRTFKKTESTDKVNDNVNMTNEISIVSDPYAFRNIAHMHCIEYMGVLWKINSVEIQYPRLILSIGGLYNAEIENS